MSAANFASWRTIPIKFLFFDRTAGAWGEEPENGEGVVCIRAADFITEELRHTKDNLTRRTYTESEIATRQLRVGDLILEKSGGGDIQPVGRVVSFELEEPALCSNFLERLRPNNHLLYSRYGAYLFFKLWTTRANVPFIKQTTGLQNLDVDEYLAQTTQVPPLDLQRDIANYLDRETAKLDAMISAKQELLEILAEKRRALITQAVTRGLNPNVRLRDSGVEWLRKIPEHWGLTRLKFITTKIGSGKTPKGGGEVYVSEGIPLIRSQNVYFTGLRLDDVVYITKEMDDDLAASRVQPNDVLLNITGASIGRSSIVPQTLSQGNVNQHVCILRPQESFINAEYLNAVLGSDIGQTQVFAGEEGISRQGLNFEEIGNFSIPIPPLDEQHAITSYLAEETTKVDDLTSVTQKTIDLLRERRTALIAAAVTGQIRISA